MYKILVTVILLEYVLLAVIYMYLWKYIKDMRGSCEV